MNRIACAAASMVAVAAGSGCAVEPDLLGTHRVQVSINGNDAGSPPVVCTQTQWLWNIETLEQTPGVIAQVTTENQAVARAVQINDLGGFTGSFWEDTTGEAEATLQDGRFTISGTAVGFFADNPSERTDASFELTTNC